MLQVEKATGKRPAGLDLGPPPTLNYLLDKYYEAFSGETMTMSELDAWSRLTGHCLDSWEYELLRHIDRKFWSVISD